MPLALPLDPLAALTFIGLLVTLLTFHEAGHALVARGYGVALLEFGLGILPRLVGVARACGRWHVVWGPRADLEAVQDATLLSLNLIPLGAFVRLAGEDDAARPGGLASAPPLGRALVFAAGPLANLILAFTILIVGFHAGWPDVVSVDSIAPGGPAAVAGQSIWYPLQLSRLAAAHGHAPGTDQSLAGTIVPRPPADTPAGDLRIGNWSMRRGVSRRRSVWSQRPKLIEGAGRIAPAVVAGVTAARRTSMLRVAAPGSRGTQSRPRLRASTARCFARCTQRFILW